MLWKMPEQTAVMSIWMNWKCKGRCSSDDSQWHLWKEGSIQYSCRWQWGFMWREKKSCQRASAHLLWRVDLGWFPPRVTLTLKHSWKLLADWDGLDLWTSLCECDTHSSTHKLTGHCLLPYSSGTGHAGTASSAQNPTSVFVVWAALSD